MLMQDLGCKVIITGSSSDVKLVKQITAHMLHRPILAVATLNIKQLGALCKELDLFITADTGPLHIANAVGAKNIIALFGPTLPMITGPMLAKNALILQKNVGCRLPCYEVNCVDNRCMKAITVEDVATAVRQTCLPAGR
jgi:ADP-heptose:LPS heptosyltransferase